jgi:hypothetical protein
MDGLIRQALGGATPAAQPDGRAEAPAGVDRK